MREALNWALQHDSHPTVRTEAIRAVYNLGLIQEEQLIKDGVLTLLTTDKSDRVRKEAEKTLVIAGIIFPTDTGNDTITTVDGTLPSPYPHILGDKSEQEVAIFLRQTLVGEKESSSVIDQVRSLSTKEAVLKHVDEVKWRSNQVVVDGLDLQYDGPFTPLVEELHKPSTARKHVKSVEKNKLGLPVLSKTDL